MHLVAESREKLGTETIGLTKAVNLEKNSYVEQESAATARIQFLCLYKYIDRERTHEHHQKPLNTWAYVLNELQGLKSNKCLYIVLSSHMTSYATIRVVSIQLIKSGETTMLVYQLDHDPIIALMGYFT